MAARWWRLLVFAGQRAVRFDGRQYSVMGVARYSMNLIIRAVRRAGFESGPQASSCNKGTRPAVCFLASPLGRPIGHRVTLWLAVIWAASCVKLLARASPLLSPRSVGDVVWVGTDDGLRLTFDSEGRLRSSSVDDEVIGSSDAGFSVFEYRSLPPSVLRNGNFSRGNGTHSAEAWTPLGVGYRRHRVPGDAGGHFLEFSVAEQRKTQWPTSGASQSIALQADGPRRMVLSAWARGNASVCGPARRHCALALGAERHLRDGTRLSMWDSPNLRVDLRGTLDWTYWFAVLELGSDTVALDITLLLCNRRGTLQVRDVKLAPFAPSELRGSAHKFSESALRLQLYEPRLGLAVDATVTGREDHVRVDGQLSRGRSGGRDDAAVTLDFAVPVDGVGWTGFPDMVGTAIPLRPGQDVAGPRQRGLFTGDASESVDGVAHVPPLPADFYPLLPVASHRHGIAVGATLERRVLNSRAEYQGRQRVLKFSIDLALTRRCARHNDSVAFSFVVFKMHHPEWGMRSALQKYAAVFPTLEDRNQGNWLPFGTTLDIRDPQDFGFKYQEGGADARVARVMNAEGVQIYPYIEPHVIHWPVNDTSSAGVVASVRACLRWPHRFPEDIVALCQAIAASAVTGPDGTWFYRVEQAPWNHGVMFYADLSPTLMSDPTSRSGRMATQVRHFYSAAAAGNYSIDGVYIDSAQGFGAPQLLNYNPGALRNATSPPVFDSSGRAAVLLAGNYLDFLANISDTIGRWGGRLFANAMYIVPHIQFATVIAVAGTETGWKDPAGRLVPPPHSEMARVRTMSYRRAYSYLMDAPFGEWTKTDTRRYHEVCLLRGIWPGFFSADAFSDPYWGNSTLYERDRPVFRKYVPLLRRVNAAGWEPVTHARSDDASVWLERWGPRADADLHYTVRNEGVSELVRVTVDAAALSLGNGSVVLRELVFGISLPVSVVSGRAEVRFPLQPNRTAVLLWPTRRRFDIRDFGARQTTSANNTEAIQRAIDACGRSGGGTVVVPAGVWMTGGVRSTSHTTLLLDEGAVLGGLTPPNVDLVLV